jgi:hypothetical protein
MDMKRFILLGPGQTHFSRIAPEVDPATTWLLHPDVSVIKTFQLDFKAWQVFSAKSDICW